MSASAVVRVVCQRCGRLLPARVMTCPGCALRDDDDEGTVRCRCDDPLPVRTYVGTKLCAVCCHLLVPAEEVAA